MRKVNNRKFPLNLLIISFFSILIVELFVRFKLSENSLALFIIRVNTMLITALMVLTSIIFIIIFLVRLALKKKNCFGRTLSIIATITIILTLATVIMIKEDNRYYHTINMNWDINLPREYEEVYYKDSGASFLGDGERYSVFQYKSLDEINNVIEWKIKEDNIEHHVTKILENLGVPTDYYPDYNNNFKYYYKTEEDRSEIYIILNSSLKKVYIVENIF